MVMIITSEAECRDCYKCIRNCPVKAIGVNNEQTWVVEEKCIFCGKCIKVCPQNAKSSVSKLDRFIEYLDADMQVVVSLAPSYLAATQYSTPWKLVAALKKLGVERVEETALGAEIISKKYQKLYNQNRSSVISSCCPTIVNLIEKYFPDLVDCLAPFLSPMLVHAKMIKAELGKNTKVVFIGPCLSKKDEPDWDSPDNPLDLVLDFEELLNYFERIGLNPEDLDDKYPDRSSSKARNYPLQRGILQVSGINAQPGYEVISVTGIEECMETFQDMEKGLITPRFIEAMACKGGCIGGPFMANDLGLAAREKRLRDFALDLNKTEIGKTDQIYFEIKRSHAPIMIEMEMPSEEEIRKILALTGKFTPEDETNCGGCGYPSCREKAIAVYQGLAEPEMCVPYMREKAESLSHAVVDSTLNAIIIVNDEMMIQEFNPAANRMFNRKGVKTKGEHLSSFIDSLDFERVWGSQEMIIDKYKEYKQYNLITRENIYPLAKYGVVIAIIKDVTNEEKRKIELDNIKQESLDRASKVIHEQMRLAQEIAGLLGESTAETKATLLELIEIMSKKEVKIGED